MDAKLSDQLNPKKLENVSEEMIDHLREDEYLEVIRKLKLQLADKTNECEALKINLGASNQEYECVIEQLNQCKLAMIENFEGSRKTQEEAVKNKKLEDDFTKLMKDYIDLSESSERYKQHMEESFIEKTNLINSYHCIEPKELIMNELEIYKQDSNKLSQELGLAISRGDFLEEQLARKEQVILDMTNIMETARLNHEQEMSYLETHVSMLRSTLSSFEKSFGYLQEQKPCVMPPRTLQDHSSKDKGPQDPPTQEKAPQEQSAGEKTHTDTN